MGCGGLMVKRHRLTIPVEMQGKNWASDSSAFKEYFISDVHIVCNVFCLERR